MQTCEVLTVRTGEKKNFKSLTDACVFLDISSQTVRDYFSRNKGVQFYANRSKEFILTKTKGVNFGKEESK